MKSVKNKTRIVGHGTATFTFALESAPEIVYELPLLQDLPIKQVRALSALADRDAAESIDAIIDLFDRFCPGLTDVATQSDAAAIMEAWSEASSISAGE